MSNDFGYVNARVRGMSSKLLGADVFDAALAAPDFDAFTSLLSSSPYASALDEARSDTPGLRAVDRALASSLRATTRSMLAFSDGTPRMMIAALLRRNDLEDLKTIARALHAGRADALEGGIDAGALGGLGELRPSVLEAMADAADLPSAAQRLAVSKHPLSPAFTRAARAYASDGDLLAFEVALDRAAFAELSREAQRLGSDLFIAYVRREIDAANLRTALKLEGRPDDAEALFVPGGREVSQTLYGQIVEAGIDGLSKLGGGTFASVAQAADASEAERAIRAALDAAAKRAALRDPLGIGVVIRYLRAREAEAAKLRLLARGAYYRVPRADLERELGHA